MAEVQQKDIIEYIRGIGDRNRRYVDCKILDQVLKTPTRGPSNIEHIAKDLAIYDPKHITPQDLLVYGQVLEALRIAEISWLKEGITDKWAEKLRSISYNPNLFEYNTDIKKEVYQEENKKNKVSIIDESNDKKKLFNKEQNQEKENDPEELEQGLETLEMQMKGLSIAAPQHQTTQVISNLKSEEEILTKGKETNLETMEIEITEQEEETNSKEDETMFPTGSIEHSRWSPDNRICNENRSFKANMLTYALPGESKEERIKYVQWILGKNHHIKTVKEVFKNGNNWIEVDFDCEHSRDAAMDRIKRKEGEWLKLIPEETKNKTYNIAQQEEHNTMRRKEKNMR
jgi:hypothetical protein